MFYRSFGLEQFNPLPLGAAPDGIAQVPLAPGVYLAKRSDDDLPLMVLSRPGLNFLASFQRQTGREEKTPFQCLL